MIPYCTVNRHGYSVKFSPLNPSLLAVAANEQFGLSGNGSLLILRMNQNEKIEEIGNRHWPNALFDICWLTETHANHILTGSGDGVLQMWSLDVNQGPIAKFLGHRQEISCIDCKKYETVPLLLSASYDKSIKIWDIIRLNCLGTLLGHSEPVLETKFSPQIPNTIASVSVDGKLKIWSHLTNRCLASIQAHNSQALSCDWSKYHDNIIATSGSDSFIRCWDIRYYRQPLFQIKGSEQPIKQIRFSPHFPHILASAAFDCSTQIWDIRQKAPLEVFRHHSGLIYGLDWNMKKIGELADCSWDSTVQVFKSEVLQNMKNKI